MDEDSIVNRLKDLFSKDRKILRSVGKMAFKGVGSVATGTVKTSSFLGNFLPQFLFIIFLFYFAGNYILDLHQYILTFLTLFETTIGAFGVYWGTNILYVYFFIFLLTLIFKSEDSEILKDQFKWLLIILTVIFLVSNFFESDFANLYSSKEQIAIGLEGSKSKLDTFMERLTCFTPDCLNKQLNKNEAKTSKASSYSFYFDKNSLNPNFALVDLKRPLYLDYKFKSSGFLTLTKMECYLGSRIENKPFFSKELGIELRTNGDIRYLDNINCGMLYDEILKNKNTSKNGDFLIIPVLYFDFETKYSQKIPIVDYSQFLASENYGSKEGYSYNFLKSNLDKITKKNKDFVQSNDALIVDDSIIKNKLPLLFGDGINREINFPLSISPKSSSSFGQFKSGEILEFNLPSSLKFKETDYSFRKNITVNNNKFIERITLIENEEGFDSSNQLVQQQLMEIKILSHFEREDRFKINVNFD